MHPSRVLQEISSFQTRVRTLFNARNKFISCFKGNLQPLYPSNQGLCSTAFNWSRAATDPFLLELCGEAGRHGPVRVTNNTQEHGTVRHTSQHPNGRKMDSYLLRLFYWEGSSMV